MAPLRKHGFIDVPVVGITGRKQSGKNWFANVLADAFKEAGYATEQVSFATPIKQACNAIFGWDLGMLEDERFKATTDTRFNITPRKAMQLLGTEFGREMVNDSIWVDIALQKVYANHRAGKITLITDVRFDNECELLTKTGGKLIKVINPLQPPPEDTHKSEAGVSYTPDFIYENEYSEEQFWVHGGHQDSYNRSRVAARAFVGSLIKG